MSQKTRRGGTSAALEPITEVVCLYTSAGCVCEREGGAGGRGSGGRLYVGMEGGGESRDTLGDT